QLLATIDPRPFQLKVAAAEAELANSHATLAKGHADLALKERNRRRQRNLRGQGIVAQSDLDTAESEARQAEAQIALAEAGVRSAEARLAEARVNLDYSRIVSPVDGVVVSRSVSVGQTVAASFQTPTLFLVATDLSKMEVSASVSESDIGGVAVGQDVTFTVDAYPGAPFRGRVTQVRNAPVNVQNVVTYDVLVGVENQDLRLKPGMTAKVSITTASRDDTVRIPTAALRFRPPAETGGAGANAATPPAGGQTVWVAEEEGKARPVAVTTGISDERFTEVTGGIAEGDRVVTGLVRAPEADAAPPRSPFMPSVPGRRGPWSSRPTSASPTTSTAPRAPSRRCAASRSPSPPASWWRSWAHRGPGSPRCSTFSAASTARARAPICSTASTPAPSTPTHAPSCATPASASSFRASTS